MIQGSGNLIMLLPKPQDGFLRDVGGIVFPLYKDESEAIHRVLQRQYEISELLTCHYGIY